MRIFMHRKLRLPNGGIITSKLVINFDIGGIDDGVMPTKAADPNDPGYNGTTAIAEYVRLNYPGWEILTTII